MNTTQHKAAPAADLAAIERPRFSPSDIARSAIITQYVSPWIDGCRTTFQFFGHSRELWIITRENTGRVTCRAEHKLGDAFDSVKANAEKLGWDKHESEVAS